MAVLACPKCEGRVFELSTNFVDIFTQCISCGYIVEVVEHYNAGDILKDQGTQIEELSTLLSFIKDQLTQATDKPEE